MITIEIIETQKTSRHSVAAPSSSFFFFDISNLSAGRLHQRILGEIPRINTTLDSLVLKNDNGD
jgi:hypothetical protein